MFKNLVVVVSVCIAGCSSGFDIDSDIEKISKCKDAGLSWEYQYSIGDSSEHVRCKEPS